LSTAARRTPAAQMRGRKPSTRSVSPNFAVGARAAEINVRERGSLIIGDSVLLNDGVHIQARLRVEICSHCKIPHNVAIMDTNFHQVDEGEDTRCAEVVIEDNVWISRGANHSARRDHRSKLGGRCRRRRHPRIPPNSLATGKPATVKRPVGGQQPL
jgi:acetyltransferase-like isoleucine patch superfamily enzyme